MPKVVIAPDKFKGSLTAAEVCQLVKRGIERFDPAPEVVSLPLADGGEGTLDLLIPRLKLETVRLTVNDPLFRPTEAYYGIQGTTAYVEMAIASGLALLRDEERNPRQTTSYGTGELIRDAIRRGARRVVVFIGGSATNDVGIGMAQALGYQFLDASGRAVLPIGQELVNIATIRSDRRMIDSEKVKVVVVSDVDNPLYGPAGAAQVYAAQKGADAYVIEQLERGLINMADRLAELTGKDIGNVPGAGAAGGFGAGALVFLDAQLRPGTATILELMNAHPAIRSADLVISGEGKVDAQTRHGKVIKGVGNLCRTCGVPLGVICGTLEADEEDLRQLNVWRAYAVRTGTMSLEQALAQTEERVVALASQLVSEFSLR